MNNELTKLWTKAQEAWLEGCINAYGKILNSAEEFLKLNKQYHEKVQENMRAKQNDDK